jgi:hypothetical protein
VQWNGMRLTVRFLVKNKLLLNQVALQKIREAKHFAKSQTRSRDR